MAVVLRYVDKYSHVIECFLKILHVNGTSTTTLKTTIGAIFATHGLSISTLWRQAYDGAGDMRGQFNRLKTLNLNENPSDYYIHCFVHLLQLSLVVVTKNHSKIDVMFTVVAKICNVVGAYAKRQDIFQEAQVEKILKGLECGELKIGKGLNHKMGLK